MIPTYNRSKYLAQTLESVLRQGFDADAMQIEVVDNRSTESQSEAIVKAIAPERVSFYRQPKHVSMTANWNTCIQRARGCLVHILHDDDYVLSGFYEAFRHAFDTHPGLALVASRCFVVDAEGEIDSLTQRISAWERPSNDPTPIKVENHLRAPAVVVRRAFYEEFGGFIDLCYVLDWEMWARAIRSRGGLFLNRPLAAYRMYPQNQTSALQQTADNLREYLKLADLWESEGDLSSADKLRQTVAHCALAQAEQFRAAGNLSGIEANLKLYRECAHFLPIIPKRRSVRSALARLPQFLKVTASAWID
jgi:glycosyltransferase involved in cell wall biosynthesis